MDLERRRLTVEEYPSTMDTQTQRPVRGGYILVLIAILLAVIVIGSFVLIGT